jgi:hypothetical protein
LAATFGGYDGYPTASLPSHALTLSQTAVQPLFLRSILSSWWRCPRNRRVSCRYNGACAFDSLTCNWRDTRALMASCRKRLRRLGVKPAWRRSVSNIAHRLAISEKPTIRPCANFRLATIRELRVSVSLTMATSVDDVTDQLLVDVFLGVAGEGSVANHSGSGRTPTCRSAASRKDASFTTTARTATCC